MSSNLYKAVRRVWRVVEYSKARRRVQTGNRFSRGCVSVMSASGGGRSDEPAARLRCRCGCADAGWLRNSWWARACAGTRYRRPTARGGARHWSAAPRGRPDTPQRTAARAPADPRRSDLYDQRATVGDGPSRAFWDLLGGLPTGRYRVSGRSPAVTTVSNGATVSGRGRLLSGTEWEAPCSLPLSVTVSAHHTVRTAVFCAVP